MVKSDKCCSTQLIDGGGIFNVTGIDNLIKEVRLGECGLSYTIVSIMGPQSSGKSTLLNHLFGTNFRVMDAFKGRYQTTKGIWLANCVGIEPCTLVMDLEGTDGSERGEDDTAFERQSALFALAVSDILLINMWFHDIAREQAANKPLLKTVFQVMLRLFNPHKTTLMFVIRDKTKTPLEKLETLLRDDVQKIWDSVPKPQAHKETPLSEFFKIEVVALSSYEEKEEQFKEQVASLRQRFFHSITTPGGLAGDRRGAVPASGFSFSAQEIWKVIKASKYLDLPAHKVMVATVRCEEIANEQFACFAANVDWCHLDEAVQSGPIPGFGKKLSSILYTYLSGYDAETTYFDEGVRSAKRKQLKENLLQLVQPAFQSLLKHTRSGTLEKFKEAFDKDLNRGKGFSLASCSCTQFYLAQFDEGCADAVIEEAHWDTSKVRDKLQRDIDAHIASVRAAKLYELTTPYKGKLKEALSGPVEALLDEANNETWPAIRKLLRCETESAITGLSGALSGFDMDEQTKDKMLSSIEEYARGVVEAKAREKAGSVLIRMKDRFFKLFSLDSDSMPRVWTGNEDIQAITKSAYSASLKLLSVLTVIRLDDDDTDNIENTLICTLMDSTNAAVSPLASSTWEEVPHSKTLITPLQCKNLWLQFKLETGGCATQAISAQEFIMHNNYQLRPSWAIVLVAFGFNAFITLLRYRLSIFFNWFKGNTTFK